MNTTPHPGTAGRAEHSAAVDGAPRPRTNGLPADAHIGRAHLRVADLERSLAFYRDVLGMRTVREEGGLVTLAAGADPEPSAAGSASSEPTSPELLVLREVPGIVRRPQRPRTTGLYHVALLVPSRGALGRALLGLHAAGYPLRGLSDHAVSESLYLDDPDGNGLEIYADRPRSAWRWQNGQVYITTEPMDVDGVVAAAGQPGQWHGLPQGTVVGHVHFTVSALGPAAAFYRDVVGFDEVARMPARDPSLVGVSAGGYHHHLNLNTWAGDGAPPDSDRQAGLDAWELVVPDAGARRALVDRLAAAGALGGRDAGVDGRPVTARDPDGITLAVAAPESR
jgi:catechol 2,3-dioxygenase